MFLLRKVPEWLAAERSDAPDLGNLGLHCVQPPAALTGEFSATVSNMSLPPFAGGLPRGMQRAQHIIISLGAGFANVNGPAGATG